jgi:hypothetical protein
VDLKEELAEIAAPHVEEAAVDHVSGDALRLIRDGFADRFGVARVSKEVTLAAGQRHDATGIADLTLYPFPPQREGRKLGEVGTLKGNYVGEGDVGGTGHFVGLPLVIRSMTQSLTSITIAKFTVKLSISKLPVSATIAAPVKRRKSRSGSGSVKIT